MRDLRPTGCCINTTKTSTDVGDPSVWCGKPAVKWCLHNNDVCSYCQEHDYTCGQRIKYGDAAPTVYVPKFVIDADQVFANLQKNLDWERRGDAPRSEYYCNDFNKPYTYGKGRGVRTYQPKSYHQDILTIREAIEEVTGTSFEVCFLNRYHDQSDHLGWHADDSPEMDDGRPIAIVSFGVEREIWFRKNGDTSGLTEKLVLGHGSLCIMLPGMQDVWQHRIPKSDRQCGERISLTFRGYTEVS